MRLLATKWKWIAPGALILLGMGLSFTGMSEDKSKVSTGTDVPSIEELKERLTEEQFCVTKGNGTERPFANAYWNNKEPGIYVCVISGEPLFSSKDKFESGTGWPSFTKPLKEEALEEVRDVSHGMERVEVRVKKADSHLGHVFPDGPGPDGLRYCMNSASLRFIPVDKLEEEGYGEYLKLFRAN